MDILSSTGNFGTYSANITHGVSHMGYLINVDKIKFGQ